MIFVLLSIHFFPFFRLKVEQLNMQMYSVYAVCTQNYYKVNKQCSKTNINKGG